jgi:hypothetical protein
VKIIARAYQIAGIGLIVAGPGIGMIIIANALLYNWSQGDALFSIQFSPPIIAAVSGASCLWVSFLGSVILALGVIINLLSERKR